MKSFRPYWFVVLFVLVIGCRGELTQEPGNVEVQVALKQASLELLSVKEVGQLPNAPAGQHAVEFVFEPSDGGEIIEGVVGDTRFLRSEFDRAGQPDPKELLADVAIFDVRVPMKKGHLLLRSETGEALGEVEIDPTGANGMDTRTQALMRDSDVLGSPIKVVDHGASARKVDLLFLPEGYTESELPAFHEHVDAIVAQLQTHSGYKEHWSGFNVWRQDVRSRNSGNGSRGRAIDTAFETASGVSGLERCMYFAGSAGLRAARELAREAGVDATVVLVNSTTHGGCAGDNIVVSSRPRNVADVVGHELAHGLFGLADEYESPSANGSCSVGPNVSFSADRGALPWSDMITTSELPTSPTASFGTVGAFEGGGYCSRGRYRPTHNCMMRTLGAGMCPVCRREVERTLARLAPDDVNGGSATVKLTNDSGSPLWARCDGNASVSCSDWTYLEDGQDATVQAPGRRIVLHNADFDAPATFDVRRATAPSANVTVFPNLVNPFVPAASAGSGGTTNPGTGNGGAASSGVLSAPSGLAPDNNRVVSDNVALAWNAINGATNYAVHIEMQSGADWATVLDYSTNTNQMNLTFSAAGRYRWRVTVCDASSCKASLDALFYVQLPATSGGSQPRPSGLPGVPAQLSPSHESAVAAGATELRWADEAAAESYNLSIRSWDDATQQWYDVGDEPGVATNAVSAGLNSPNTWYAWAVQACNGAGCSEWTEYSLLYTEN